MIKVKAHLTTNTTEAKGNALADVAAKQACFYATVQVCSGSTAQKTILPPESIVDLYKDALYVTPRVHTATTRRSGSRTRDSGAGGGRSNKERQRLQPLASVARAPLFEVRRVRFYTQPLLA